MARPILPSLRNTGMTRYFRATSRETSGDDVVLDLEVGQVDHFGAKLRGLGLGHVARADDLVGHQQIHHPHAGGVGFLASLGHHIGTGEAEVNQQVQ